MLFYFLVKEKYNFARLKQKSGFCKKYYNVRSNLISTSSKTSDNFIRIKSDENIIIEYNGEMSLLKDNSWNEQFYKNKGVMLAEPI